MWSFQTLWHLFQCGWWWASLWFRLLVIIIMMGGRLLKHTTYIQCVCAFVCLCEEFKLYRNTWGWDMTSSYSERNKLRVDDRKNREKERRVRILPLQFSQTNLLQIALNVAAQFFLMVPSFICTKYSNDWSNGFYQIGATRF